MPPSTGKTKVSDVPIPTIEIEFSLGAVVVGLNFQTVRTSMWVANKFFKNVILEPSVDGGRLAPKMHVFSEFSEDDDRLSVIRIA